MYVDRESVNCLIAHVSAKARKASTTRGSLAGEPSDGGLEITSAARKKISLEDRDATPSV